MEHLHVNRNMARFSLRSGYLLCYMRSTKPLMSHERGKIGSFSFEKHVLRRSKSEKTSAMISQRVNVVVIH